MLIFREAEIIGGFPADVGLSFGIGDIVDLSKVRPFDNLEDDALSIVEVDKELIGAHFNNMFLDRDGSTCLSYVFSEMRMKVPELLPQSLM